MNIPYEKLAPHRQSMAFSIVTRAAEILTEQAAKREKMIPLSQENSRLLEEMIALEKEMKQQPTLALVQSFQRRIDPLRAKVNANYAAMRAIIKDILPD